MRSVFAVVAAALLTTACTTSAPRTAAPEITIRFDYSAAELMLATLQKKSISDEEAAALLANRGVDAIVTKTMVWVPSLRRDDFLPYLRSVLAGDPPLSAFGLAEVNEHRAEVEGLIRTLRANESAITARMASRLARYSPVSEPLTIDVFFVAGGSSDGFVLDDDPRRAFFVALDKASGDVDGVEQNMTHELYHVMQKAAMQQSEPAARFAATIDKQPLLQQLMATTLWEGTANFAADARETPGDGPYVSMWRGRYLRSLTDAKLRENFALFDTIAADLAAGSISWQDAYDRGFSGGNDSPLYFVGMEMARALSKAHGPDYFRTLFTRPVGEFFRDYIALTERDATLHRLAPMTTGS